MTKKIILKKAEDKFILSILKNNSAKISSILDNKKLNWYYILTTVVKNKIKSVFSFNLSKYKSDKIPKFVKNFIKESLIEYDLNKKIYLKEISLIKKKFDENKIDFILLKGLSIDHTYYRDIGDLDILIQENHLNKAGKLLNELNYFYTKNSSKLKLSDEEINDLSKQVEWNAEFGFYNSSNELLIELHTNIFIKKYKYQENIKSLTNNIKLFFDNKIYNEHLKCYILNREFLLILMCMHNAIKRTLYNNHFILRTLLDIKNILSRGIDWEKIFDAVKILKISPHIYFSLQLTDELFPDENLKEKISILKKNLTKNELFITCLHNKCFYNFNKSSLLITKIYIILMPFIFSGGTTFFDKLKNILMIPYIIPPRWRMSQIYNINKNSPLIFFTYFLNPFRWIYLIFLRVVFKK